MGKKKFVKGYQAITWLVGHVFLDKRFVGRLDEEGLDAVLVDCPYDDLSSDQREAFEAMISRWEYRLLLHLFWAIYDYLRWRGVIPETLDPWMP